VLLQLDVLLHAQTRVFRSRLPMVHMSARLSQSFRILASSRPYHLLNPLPVHSDGCRLSSCRTVMPLTMQQPTHHHAHSSSLLTLRCGTSTSLLATRSTTATRTIHPAWSERTHLKVSDRTEPGSCCNLLTDERTVCIWPYSLPRTPQWTPSFLSCSS